MLDKNKSLQILLGVLIVLIVVASIVVAKMPRQREVVYYDTSPDYDQNLLMLGVRMSKFSGMSIYMDSPSVLLAKSEKLQLTAEQQQKLQAVVDQARAEARSLLTEEQLAEIAPIPSEPVVLEKMDKTIPSCADGACSDAPAPQGFGHVHDHNCDHDHGH